MSEETIEKTYQVSEGARLKLSNIRGTVEIRTGEAGVIAVKAVKSTGTGNGKHTTIEMSQAEDGTVNVETHHQEGTWRIFNFISPAKVDYQVRVPPACSLRVSCVSSSLSIHGVNGEFNLNTVSGSMDLQDLVGSLKINSVSGDVTGSRLKCELHLETVSGDIRLSDSDLPTMHGNTVSGDVILHTALGSGPYKISSVSGDVQLFVPEDCACTAEVSGVSGRLTSTLPMTAQHRHGGVSSAEIQGGGTLVKMNSVSGDLWIGKPGDEPGEGSPIHPASHSTPIPPVPPLPPLPPIPPIPPAPPEPLAPPERLTTAEILAMVERGEISVEEAIHRMQS